MPYSEEHGDNRIEALLNTVRDQQRQMAMLTSQLETLIGRITVLSEPEHRNADDTASSPTANGPASAIITAHHTAEVSIPNASADGSPATASKNRRPTFIRKVTFPDTAVLRIVTILSALKGLDGGRGRNIMMPNAAKALRKIGNIEFRDYGFGSAKAMFDYLVSKQLIRYDGLDKGGQPIISVQDNRPGRSRDTRMDPTKHATPSGTPASIPSPLGAMERFAYMGAWSATLPQLAELAEYEPWDFPSRRTAHPSYDILRQYLRGTFVRLKEENKILVNTERKLAAFNTGLLSKSFDQIYALFVPNPVEHSFPWRFQAFCCAGIGYYGQQLAEAFPELPSAAEYFDDRNDLYMNPHAALHVDTDHLMSDKNLSRLPLSYVESLIAPDTNLYDRYVAYRDDSSMSNANFYQAISKILAQNVNFYRRYRGGINSAADIAMTRVKADYKVALPIWHITQGTFSFLLPLCLTSSGAADVALVVERVNPTTYQGKTLLTLTQAYHDARLLCRQDGGWLKSAIFGG